MPFIINSLFKIFLSTLSLRRATWLVSYSAPSLLYFYPRSPCGERRQHRQSNPAGHRISIHALLAESDQHLCICVIELIHFYPRSPCGERPRPQPPKARVLYFYPRAPCGERRVKRFHAADISYFYPRSPCGERQAANGLAHAPPEISIHALLAESDAS